MRFLMIVKANKDCEAGKLPPQEAVAAIAKYNDELVKAGALLNIAGLHPSSEGARITFSGEKRTVVDGPFAETKELIGGYWLIQAKSKAEAVEWAKRVPFQAGEIEIRQLHDLEYFQPSDAVRRACGQAGVYRQAEL